MSEEPIQTESKRNPDGTFAPGNEGGPGRPKGKTLKEFARDYLATLPDDQKTEYLKSLPKDIVWKMAEGNPAQDVTSGGEKINPIPIYGGVSNNDSDNKDIQPEKKD